jgi:hypothetical protein
MFWDLEQLLENQLYSIILLISRAKKMNPKQQLDKNFIKKKFS